MVYVRDEDQELWRRAERLAGKGSLSAVLTKALRGYIEAKEAERLGMERIELEFGSQDDQPYRKAFMGRWLVSPDNKNRFGDDAGACYGVAQTKRGQIAVYQYHVNDRWPPSLTVYGSFAEAERAGVPKDLLAIAAEAAGDDYVEELDI
jgi:hypothetical protein